MKIKVMRCYRARPFQILLIFVLAASANAPVVARRRPCASAEALQTTLSAVQKLKRAEVAADRLIERFHETLDFRTVLDESFVTEPELRKLALVFGQEAHKRAHYDEPLNERIFTSTMTFLHLYAESMMIMDEPPQEVEKAQAGLKDCTIDNSHKSDPMTSAAMEQCLDKMDQVSTLLRKQFTPGIFESRLYLKNIADERSRAERNGHNVPRIEKGNEKFDISPETPVYIIRRESFDYYFIEEKGAFRLFYVDILPNFKLF